MWVSFFVCLQTKRVSRLEEWEKKGSGDGYQVVPKGFVLRFCLFQEALPLSQRPLAQILPYLPQNTTCISTMYTVMFHGSKLWCGFSPFSTGDAEGRGADADLPERHVPQQARVQR